jgi:hypothetical protein
MFFSTQLLSKFQPENFSTVLENPRIIFGFTAWFSSITFLTSVHYLYTPRVDKKQEHLKNATSAFFSIVPAAASTFFANRSWKKLVLNPSLREKIWNNKYKAGAVLGAKVAFLWHTAYPILTTAAVLYLESAFQNLSKQKKEGKEEEQQQQRSPLPLPLDIPQQNWDTVVRRGAMIFGITSIGCVPSFLYSLPWAMAAGVLLTTRFVRRNPSANQTLVSFITNRGTQHFFYQTSKVK